MGVVAVEFPSANARELKAFRTSYATLWILGTRPLLQIIPDTLVQAFPQSHGALSCSAHDLLVNGLRTSTALAHRLDAGATITRIFNALESNAQRGRILTFADTFDGARSTTLGLGA